MLYFHGGGYCSGSILSHRRLVTEAGRAAKARTLAIEYRLAPEHPFPAALDDALSAWNFLRKSGIAAEHIAVGGDSAGGGLTVALINRLRDAGERGPGLRLADLAMDRPDAVGLDTRHQRCGRSDHSQGEYLAELVEAYLPACHGQARPAGLPALCAT